MGKDPPQDVAGRCIARTRHGSPCSAPALVGKPYCFFHDPSGDIAAARDAARGKGLRRQRVLAPMNELPPLDFDTPEQVRAFKTELARRVLGGAIEPQVAKVAGELCESIHRESRKGDEATAFNLLAQSIVEELRSRQEEAFRSPNQPPPIGSE